MNRKTFTTLLSALLLSTVAFAAVNDQVVTQQMKLKELHIALGDTASTIYFIPDGATWGAQGCENARWAYMYDSHPSSDSVLSLALAARASQLSITLEGTCGNNDGNDQYIRIQRIIL